VARTDVSAVSDTVNPGGTTDDIVMCLSCHGAHATNFYKLMRWDYNGDEGGDLAEQLSGCIVCHTSKN
jgi:cytochrome c553